MIIPMAAFNGDVVDVAFDSLTGKLGKDFVRFEGRNGVIKYA